MISLDDAIAGLANALPLIGLGITVFCVGAAFWYGESQVSEYPERWRQRAQYLRWLSMAALAAMGVLVVSVVRIPFSPGNDGLGKSIVLGLIAAMMAGVYRYIIRLGYFYEARADAAEVLADEGKMPALKTKTQMAHFILLCKALSPDGLEYTEAQSLVGEIVNVKKDLLDKK